MQHTAKAARNYPITLTKFLGKQSATKGISAIFGGYVPCGIRPPARIEGTGNRQR